jgi:hypothetical protein
MDYSSVVSGATYQPSEGVMASQVGDEAILLDLGSGIYYSLNAAGAPIWTALVGGRCQTEIVDALVADFDVTPAVAARDVESFIARLVELGLVRPS